MGSIPSRVRMLVLLGVLVVAVVSLAVMVQSIAGIVLWTHILLLLIVRIGEAQMILASIVTMT